MSDLGERRRAIQDAAVAQMRTRTFNWCRARVLLALSGISHQGLLEEILEELLGGDQHDLAERLMAALRATGWLTDEESMP